jgi:ribosomal protein S6
MEQLQYDKEVSRVWTSRDESKQVRVNLTEKPLSPQYSSFTQVTGFHEAYRNPEWRQQVKTGRNACTRLVASRFRQKSTPYWLVYQRTNPSSNPNALFQVHRVGKWYYNPSWSGSEPSEELANAQALTQLQKKIQSALTRVQAGVFIGESAELVRMIRSPAKSLREGLRSYLNLLKKRGNKIARLRDARKRELALKKMAAGTWLEWNFGVSPTLRDIEDAKSYIAERVNRLVPELERVRGYGSHSLALKDNNVLGQTSINTPRYELYISRVKTVEVIYDGRVRVGRDHGVNVRSLGLGPANFVPTLWELLPYSFVADYFSNIGEIISALSSGWKDVAWMNKTVRTTLEWKSTRAIPTSLNGWTLIQDKRPVLSGSHTGVVRDVYHGSLVPRIAFEMPGLGSLKWINLAALVVGGRHIEKVFRAISARHTYTE